MVLQELVDLTGVFTATAVTAFEIEEDDILLRQKDQLCTGREVACKF